MTTWLQLAHKTAIVTGAGSGIGAAVARALVAEQCNVVLADRDLQAVEETAKTIMQPPPPHSPSSSSPTSTRLLCVQCDVTDAQSVFSLIQQADEFASTTETEESVATLLVNSAGIARDSWVSKMNLDDWDVVLNVNLKGTFLPCRAFLDQDRMQRIAQELEKQQQQQHQSPLQMSIVNMGSIVSDFGSLGVANYSASKGGVVALTKTLAKESASRNVRVNTVLPGFINTPMGHGVPESVQEFVRSRTPMGRFGEPEEVSNLVTFLLSPRSSYITGEAIRVSGMQSL